jgi:hypothetical protein
MDTSPSFTPPPEERLPHSAHGVRSFRLALPTTIIFIVTLVVIRSTDHLLDDVAYFPLLILINLCFWGSTLVAISAFISGIKGLFQQHVRKVFSILGLIFSGIPLLWWVAALTISMFGRIHLSL